MRRGTFFAFHFSKPLKFVLGLPKGEFFTRDKHFTTGKNSGKVTLPPKYSSYAPAEGHHYQVELNSTL